LSSARILRYKSINTVYPITSGHPEEKVEYWSGRI